MQQGVVNLGWVGGKDIAATHGYLNDPALRLLEQAGLLQICLRPVHAAGDNRCPTTWDLRRTLFLVQTEVISYPSNEVTHRPKLLGAMLQERQHKRLVGRDCHNTSHT